MHGSSVLYVHVSLFPEPALVFVFAGRLTFTPLKRLATKAPKFPEGIPAEDAVPLLSLLTYHPRFQPAVHAAFGKVMVCRNIDVAERLADTHKLTCVTQEGAKAKGRGEFSGGFYEPGKGIFGLRDSLKAAKDAVASLETRYAELLKVSACVLFCGVLVLVCGRCWCCWCCFCWRWLALVGVCSFMSSSAAVAAMIALSVSRRRTSP